MDYVGAWKLASTCDSDPVGADCPCSVTYHCIIWKKVTEVIMVRSWLVTFYISSITRVLLTSPAPLNCLCCTVGTNTVTLSKKPKAPVPSNMEGFCCHRSGSGYLLLRVEDAKNIRVTNSCRKKMQYIATYKALTLPSFEQEETRLVWNLTAIIEVRVIGEGFTTLQSGHLLCYSRLSHKQEMEKQNSEGP